jgi:hypothetical protein
MSQHLQYAGAATVLDARSQYFERAGFDSDGGYAAKWVKLKVGPARVAFPNSACRVRSVKLHDVHHILTEYDTSWTGEAEIAAWEVASGCRDHYVAWLLDLGAMLVGLVIAPKRTFRAFVRGRRSRNLYNGDFTPTLLESTVGELREKLDIPVRAPKASAADVVAFGWWSGIATILTLGPYILAIVAMGAMLLLR